MMKKLPATVTGQVYVVYSSFADGVFLSSSTFAGTDGYACLSSEEITVNVPQEDPTPKIIQALEERAEDIQAEASAAVRQIMDQIRTLQCLEHLPGGDE